MYHPPGLQPGFLYHMDLVPDCTMNLFPSEDLLSRWGTRYQSKMKRVWFPTPELMLEIRSFPICAGVTPVGLWFVILLDKLEDFFFFSQRFSTHEGFTSDSFNFIRHGLAPECECISFLQRLPVQFREGKTAAGVDDSRRWKAVSAHAAPLSWNKILYTCFFDTDRPW